MQSLLILGRQPEIGLAELESLYGAENVEPICNKSAAILDVDPCLVSYDRLGGSVKFCKLLLKLPTVDWQEIEKFLINTSPMQSKNMPPGKMYLGISAFGFNKNYKEILKTAINIKIAIKPTGRSVRVIPNKDTTLSSAQVIHNHLTSVNGWELNIIKEGNETYIAQTIRVQNIFSYAKRDQNRPSRDPRIGMLPPKLAQIIINLASGRLAINPEDSICEIDQGKVIPPPFYEDKLLLDPFCGTGVILQEAALMGYSSIGTDLDERMITYSSNNIEWLKKTHKDSLHPDISIQLETGDATSYKWSQSPSFVASETYLGPPLSQLPDEKLLKPIIKNCDRLILNFLKNIQPYLKADSQLCLAIPAWRSKETQNRFVHLTVIDSLETIGYNRLSFKYSEPDKLIYCRPNQIVGRELLVLKKI